jgi:MerR family transcriptional regulator, light-induced transcriptional regulator
MSKDLKQAAQSIREMRDHLAETIVSRQYAQQADTWRRYGDAGRVKSVRDAGYHLTYLAEALAAADPVLFNDYLAWVKILFNGLKFKSDVVPQTLQYTREVLNEYLPAQAKQAALTYVDLGLLSFRNAPPTLPSLFEGEPNPLTGTARAYTEALLVGDRQAATRMILDLVPGTPIKDIYLHIFQPSLREIGRLWQVNEISVAQEHFCTAATQVVMSLLYPNIFASERKGLRMVATCVSDELHEIGARMVADFFEMEGWDTYFLGANTPPEGILRALVDRDAQMLAISATMTFHVEKVTELISLVRQEGLDARVKIMVGGYPFNLSSNLWKVVGADAYAHDAQQAIRMAEELLA